MSLNIFDSYNMRARLSVSFFYAAPFIIDLLITMKDTFSLSEGIIITAILIAIFQSIIPLFRSFRNKDGDGNIAATMLAPISQLSDLTKKRYYRKLAGFELEFAPFASYNNSENDGITSELCDDAVKWLRSKTRDSNKFPLVCEENTNYGFIKNMKTYKAVGLIINILAFIAFCIYGILCWIDSENLKIALESLSASFYISIMIHFVVILYLLFMVNKKAVAVAATKYACALLESIDNI